MTISLDGVPVGGGGGGGLGPNTVTTTEVLDGSIGVVDLGFDPYATGSSKRPVRTVSASGPINPTDDLILANSTAGALILDLEATPADGDTCYIKHWVPVNSLTVNGNGKNIEGSATIVYPPLEKTGLVFTYSSAVDEWVIG